MLQTSRNLLQNVVLRSGTDLIPFQNAMGVQQVRHKYRARKPLYTIPAKSKWFRIPVRLNLPPEEEIEVRRLRNQHKTFINSISQYFRDENARHAEGSKLAEEHYLAEEEDWKRCLEINDQWNKEIAVLREERLRRESEAEEQAILKQLRDQEELRKQRMEEIEAIVRKEKELSKTFVTKENIDAAIAYALENPVDFNFSIDVQGNHYQGRFTKPKPPTKSPNVSSFYAGSDRKIPRIEL